MRLTRDDITNIVYYYQEYYDISDWIGYSNAMVKIQDDFPEVVLALRNLQASKRLADFAIEKLAEKAYDYPEDSNAV